MALGILIYDVTAVKTQKMETMSAAVWRSLTKPNSMVPLLVIWGVLTHHLFANKNAIQSYKTLLGA